MLYVDVIQMLQGVDGSEMAFNYFFTLMMLFGLLSFGVGLLVKMINRS